MRVYSYDATLGVHTRRIVGYRAACSCEWRGPVRVYYAAAMADGRQHRAEHEPPRP